MGEVGDMREKRRTRVPVELHETCQTLHPIWPHPPSATLISRHHCIVTNPDNSHRHQPELSLILNQSPGQSTVAKHRQKPSGHDACPLTGFGEHPGPGIGTHRICDHSGQ